MATVAPSNFFCPISQEMMHDPVITMDGHSYEREQIESWFRRSTLSPVTGGALTHVHLTPNHALRNAIEQWSEANLLLLPRSSLTLEPRPIGAGSSKRVFRAQLRLPGFPRAKTVAALEMRNGTVDTEASVFLRLGRHPHLVRFFGQCTEGDNQFLVTEFAQHGSISDWFATLEDNNRLSTISNPHRLVMMQQICSGMEKLASEGCIHRDLAAR